MGSMNIMQISADKVNATNVVRLTTLQSIIRLRQMGRQISLLKRLGSGMMKRQEILVESLDDQWALESPNVSVWKPNSLIELENNSVSSVVPLHNSKEYEGIPGEYETSSISLLEFLNNLRSFAESVDMESLVPTLDEVSSVNGATNVKKANLEKKLKLKDEKIKQIEKLLDEADEIMSKQRTKLEEMKKTIDKEEEASNVLEPNENEKEEDEDFKKN